MNIETPCLLNFIGMNCYFSVTVIFKLDTSIREKDKRRTTASSKMRVKLFLLVFS
jgi:hypothetical protein